MPVTGRILLDTSVVVAVLRRAPGMIERLRGQEELLVPLVVLGELRYGANLATPPDRQHEAVRTFMASATLLLPTERTAAEYARIKASLKAAGTRCPKTTFGSRESLASTGCRSRRGTPTSAKSRISTCSIGRSVLARGRSGERNKLSNPPNPGCQLSNALKTGYRSIP